MKPIQIFGSGIKSRSENATAQSRVNLYLEQTDDKGVVAYGTPGLTLSATISATDPIRGLYSRRDTRRFAVHLDTFYSIDDAGTATNKGTLLTNSGLVDITDNGIQITITDGTYGYVFDIATQVFTMITDVDFPGGGHVTFNDGYTIVNQPGTGKFFLSDSYNSLSWDALMFATAESNPDHLVRPYADHGQLILFGVYNTEFWGDSGDVDFPYTRISGVTAEWGLGAEWSLAKFGSSLIMLGKNHLGDVQVVKLNGYNFEKVSTFDLEAIFHTYDSVSDATGFSYVINGHEFYQLNFPSENQSWLYDGTMNIWSELKYGNQDNRHRSELSTVYKGDVYTSDWENGLIYKIDVDSYTDNGEAIVSELVTKHATTGLELLSISELQLDMFTGAGLSTGQGSDPQVMLQISRDNGHTWGNERWMSFGAIGNYTTRAMWRRLGQARDWVFKFRISDPVKKVINGVWIR